MKKTPFVLLALIFAFSNCKKETTPTAPAPCSIVYSAWSCCSNNLLTRTYSLSSTNCTDIPPVDSLQRDCVMPKEVIIGSQVWTATNLDVSTYRNGDSIPHVQDATTWATLTTGAWCYFNNNSTNGTKYGKLYNGYAVNDTRGLAPTGYHIPTDAEWDILRDYLGNIYILPGYPINTLLAKNMKSTTGWKKGMKPGNYIYYVDGNGTNVTCFAGLPGGMRNNDGYFCESESYSYWWTSKDSAPNPTLKSSVWFMWHSDTYFSNGYFNINSAYSVRCIKD